jgi:hypothetical protein
MHSFMRDSRLLAPSCFHVSPPDVQIVRVGRPLLREFPWTRPGLRTLLFCRSDQQFGRATQPTQPSPARHWPGNRDGEAVSPRVCASVERATSPGPALPACHHSIGLRLHGITHTDNTAGPPIGGFPTVYIGNSKKSTRSNWTVGFTQSPEQASMRPKKALLFPKLAPNAIEKGQRSGRSKLRSGGRRRNTSNQAKEPTGGT